MKIKIIIDIENLTLPSEEAKRLIRRDIRRSIRNLFRSYEWLNLKEVKK